MIELAKRRRSQYAKQIEFCVADATNRESLLGLKRNRAFTKAVSNMAIMDITDIEPLFMAVYELLEENGIFVFATQHPCFITLTEKYMTPHSYYDIATHCEKLELFDIISEKFELDGAVKEIYIAGGNSHIELDNNSPMEIYVADYTGRIDVNQISAKSRLHVPHEYAFKAVKKGIRTKLLFEDRGHLVDDFSVSESENQIEINGINSELTIVKLSE